MEWAEGRIYQLERRLEALARQLADLALAVKALQQGLIASQQQQGGESSAEIDEILYCEPSGAISAGTGTWPAITPGTTTADVYSSVTGLLVLGLAGATVKNFMPDATTTGHRVIVKANGDGTFDAIGESCT